MAVVEENLPREDLKEMIVPRLRMLSVVAEYPYLEETCMVPNPSGHHTQNVQREDRASA